MKHALFFILATCVSWVAQAMQVEVHGTTVYAAGRVVDDYRKFQDALAQPGVDTVVFVNSPGGDLWTGIRVGQMIADKGLKTVVAGSCASACSIMFMGGKERSFSDVFRPALTFVGIHGAHLTATKTVDPQLQPQMYAFYKQHMAERFNAAVINKALYDMDDAGALLRVFDSQRTPRRHPYHCRSAQSARQECTDFRDLDDLSLGIVTTRQLTPLTLPVSFQVKANLWGRNLTQPLAEPSVYFQDLAAKHCSTDACRKQITDFGASLENKAVATPVSGPGLGAVSNRDTAANAFAGAIYACNHPKDQPARLCETRTVNDHDLNGFYASAMAGHARALAQLSPPLEKFHGNEEFGGAFTRASGLRTKNLIDITPQTLDGLQTLGTQALAQALKSAEPPVLIDVWAGVNEAIPSAVTLLFGGAAFDDAGADRAYEARFSGLLKLLSPDPTRPVVFYCQNRECWLAVNAALRAQKLGYTQISWYRGGMDSWRAARLPVAGVVVRAVVR
jgi:PQQ-dependent catabolism-associated CXXCW motif protein